MNEMARQTGSYDSGSFNGKSEWDYYKENPEFLTLIKDNISSKKYKLYQVGKSGIYFLTDKNNEFKGKITGEIKNNNLYIEGTEKDKSVKGFYSMLFSVLLGYTKIKGILSDTLLSPEAIKAYEKLDKSNTYLNIYVTDGKNNYKFSKEKLLESPKNRVLVTTDKKELKEHFETIEKRKNKGSSNIEDQDYNSFKKMFIESSTTLDVMEFGDYLENLV